MDGVAECPALASQRPFADTAIANPIDALDHPNQEDLWRELDARCVAADGCRALAIPHNSNIGMGGTFRVDPEDAESLAIRARFERLAEVFQHKGQSECFPGAVLSDDACDFEIMLPVPVSRRQAASPGALTPEEFAATASGYLRNALGRGLAIETETGVNPFRFGLIGSTDSHTASPGQVDERDWAGAFGNVDDTFDEQLRTPQYNPGGLVAVWARENTRESVSPHSIGARPTRPRGRALAYASTTSSALGYAVPKRTYVTPWEASSSSVMSRPSKWM